jgi:hypothetical protein
MRLEQMFRNLLIDALSFGGGGLMAFVFARESNGREGKDVLRTYLILVQFIIQLGRTSYCLTVCGSVVQVSYSSSSLLIHRSEQNIATRRLYSTGNSKWQLSNEEQLHY